MTAVSDRGQPAGQTHRGALGRRGDRGTASAGVRTLAALLSCVLAVTACAGDDSTNDGARDRDEGRAEMTDTELAAQAYVAGYPLVVSIRTLQRLGGLVGVNRLLWQTSLAGPQSRIIVAPNRDTLYSVAVLDLRSGADGAHAARDR